MLSKLWMYPSKNLHILIPIVVGLSIVVGLHINMSVYKPIILPFTFLMILFAVIGFPWSALFYKEGTNALLVSLILNFIVIPFYVWLTISTFHFSPEISIAFIILAAFPTSSMSIIWTVLAKGNISLAIRISTISLIIGAIVLPFYLLVMIGQTVAIPIIQVIQSIILVVIIPLLLSQVFQKITSFMKNKSDIERALNQAVPLINSWLLLIVIFLNISLQAEGLYQYKMEIVSLTFAFILFYVLTFTTATMIAKKWFTKDDGIALVYGTAIRHISISLGIAIITFGGITGFAITFAYIIQAQAAAWYGKIANYYIWPDINAQPNKMTENSKICN